jgi:putative intracellular septation protein A
VAYTRRVTQIWCGFFILNGSLASLFVLLEQYRWWAVYTGIIAYILMGILMGGEFAYRKWVLKLNPKTSDKRHSD